jgi:hypothetical protein
VVVFRRVTVTSVSVVLLALVACRRLDPQQELAVSDVETYWVVDAPVGDKRYLAPAVRFKVANKGNQAQRSIEATAVFRRQGETEGWGSDWQRVIPGGKPLEPGQSAVLVLRSDGRYYSQGEPDTMFRHELFKDASVQVFLRLGSSGWVKFLDVPVERRVGSRAASAS